MNPRRWCLLLAVLCLSAHSPRVSASTVSPPRDLGELLRLSDAVVLAEAGESWGEPGGMFPYTATRFYLLEQVSGQEVGAVFEVSEMGGKAAGAKVAVSGSPEFVAGRRYLLFLHLDQAGRWRPRMLSYGLLEETVDGSLLQPLEASGAIELIPLGGRVIEPVVTYRKGDLLRHLGGVAKGFAWKGSGVVATAADLSKAAANGARLDLPGLHDLPGDGLAAVTGAAVKPAACNFLSVSDIPFRWFGFENGAATATVFATTPGQVGMADGGALAVQQGVAAWTNHADSVIRYQYGGTRPAQVTCTAGSTSDRDAGGVLFNDPCGDIVDLSVNCAGTLARGGVAAGGGQGSHDGATWYTITSPFVVVNNGAACLNNFNPANFAEMMTHELGHSLGFGHHAVAAAPNNPTMSSTLKADGRGAALVGADKACAAYAYHTFRDVPSDFWAWRWIEAIENAGVTGGCGNGGFCPGTTVTREQMAIFLLRAKEGAAYTPPACTGAVFSDVPCSLGTAAWINQLAARGITGGCGGGKFCPTGPVNRGQMAVFLLATREGSGYRPPACTVPRFADVPCSNPLAAWINEIAARGISGGCGGGKFCPAGAVSRAEMAVFLSATFGLPLP
jgi:S-layer homology domain